MGNRDGLRILVVCFFSLILFLNFMVYELIKEFLFDENFVKYRDMIILEYIVRYFVGGFNGKLYLF